jgi:Flp pilus assembly protein TadG
MRRRGSTMVEAALVTTTFIILLVGVMDFGRLGFAYNSVTYAAHHAARFAATNGSASGHAATSATILSNVESNIVALDTTALTVTTTWTPNNSPGSQVQVVVSYGFKPMLLPISATSVNLKCTASSTIIQ